MFFSMFIVGRDYGPNLRDQGLDWHGRLLRFLDAGEDFIEERKLGRRHEFFKS
jgi:hypothetical protein